jgi:hypothetical protein
MKERKLCSIQTEKDKKKEKRTGQREYMSMSLYNYD